MFLKNMTNNNKILIGLISISSACACYFSIWNPTSFTKAEDVIHTVIIDSTHNHLPESTGNHTLVNEVGTEINCKTSLSVGNFTYYYGSSYCSLGNSGSYDGSYSIEFFINGIVSFDFTFHGSSYPIDGLYAELTKDKELRDFGALGNIHLEDSEALSTKAEILIPVRAMYSVDFESIVVKYSESSCRAISNL